MIRKSLKIKLLYIISIIIHDLYQNRALTMHGQKKARKTGPCFFIGGGETHSELLTGWGSLKLLKSLQKMEISW